MSSIRERTQANGHSSPAQPQGMGTLPSGTLGFLTQSLKKQWWCYRKELKRCQKKFSAGGVHQSRVATRRLLSLFALLGPFLPAAQVRKIETALKKHLDTFDDLRDTQVQLQAVKKLRGEFAAARRFSAFLCNREERFSRKTRKNVKTIKTARLGKLISKCRRELALVRENSTAGASNRKLMRVIESSFARTWRLRGLISRNDPRAIHCTRVAFKKYRYMIETLSKRLAWANARRLDAMHDYQTMMGEIQDAEVLRQTFDKFARKKKIETAQAAKMRGELLRRRTNLIEHFWSRADQLLEFCPSPHKIGLLKQHPRPAGGPALGGLETDTQRAKATWNWIQPHQTN